MRPMRKVGPYQNIIGGMGIWQQVCELMIASLGLMTPEIPDDIKQESTRTLLYILQRSVISVGTHSLPKTWACLQLFAPDKLNRPGHFGPKLDNWQTKERRKSLRKALLVSTSASVALRLFLGRIINGGPAAFAFSEDMQLQVDSRILNRHVKKHIQGPRSVSGVKPTCTLIRQVYEVSSH